VKIEKYFLLKVEVDS